MKTGLNCTAHCSDPGPIATSSAGRRSPLGTSPLRNERSQSATPLGSEWLANQILDDDGSPPVEFADAAATFDGDLGKRGHG
jgi:hypothetical protein